MISQTLRITKALTANPSLIQIFNPNIARFSKRVYQRGFPLLTWYTSITSQTSRFGNSLQLLFKYARHSQHNSSFILFLDIQIQSANISSMDFPLARACYSSLQLANFFSFL
jgi:hypothetical protein